MLIIIILLLVLIIILAYSNLSNDKSTNIIKPLQAEGMSVDAFFKYVNNKDSTVFVYFNADWCVPCIKLKPVIDQIEQELKSKKLKIKILSLDVDENKDLAIHFEINTLPLFQIYKNGKKVWEHDAFMNKQDLSTRIEMYK